MAKFLSMAIPAVCVIVSAARADLVGGPYSIGPRDANAGGSLQVSASYSIRTSTGQAGGVGVISSATYDMSNGFQRAAAVNDCNNNGVDDNEDIDPSDPDGNNDVSLDCDGNGVPDECAVDPPTTVIVGVEIELAGVHVPVTRCIHLEADECGEIAYEYLSFIDHDGDDANTNGIADVTEGTSDTAATPVRYAGNVLIPCGTRLSLCCKDAQHTAWGNSALSLAGGAYTANAVLSLRGGDTDNDGDVDINDVTWMIYQFGSPTVDGWCPWNGTARDADFSNNGAVGTEDYTFLTANIFTTSSCDCFSSLAPPGPEDNRTSISVMALPPEVALQVDLNKDGRVDHEDVKSFEFEYGLPDSLSSKIRTRAASDSPRSAVDRTDRR